jgi:putative ABC transport system substrate-binding protein
MEGQNILIEYRYGEGLPALASELVSLKVDVIVAVGTAAIRAAKEATGMIPIVMAISADPVGSGFVVSLARPGGNITGLTNLAPELRGKGLELLKEVVPRLSRVAVLSNPANPAHSGAVLKEIKAAARTLGLQIQIVEARRPDDFDSAFHAATKGRSGALSVLGDPILGAHSGKIADLALKYRLPSIFQFRENAEAGGLMSYGPKSDDLWRRAAVYVDKILKGAKPADLPVEQPTKFELVINLKAAKQIGLTIPPNVLARADRVIR